MLQFQRHNACRITQLQSGEKQGKVTKLSKGEVLMLNIGSMCTGAKVIAVRTTYAAVDFSEHALNTQSML